MIKKINCIACGMCAKDCIPRRCITVVEDGVEIDLDVCNACGHCQAVCPTDAMDNPKAPRQPLCGEHPAAEDMERYLRMVRSVRQWKDSLVPRETMERL